MNSKKVIREKAIPWDGLARAAVVSTDLANLLKVLEPLSAAARRDTVLKQVDLYATSVLGLLGKAELRDDVLKSVLVLVNDLVTDPAAEPFLQALLRLAEIDASLPYAPFLQYLGHAEQVIRSVSLHNLVVVLAAAARRGAAVDKETAIPALDCSLAFVESSDANLQLIGTQLLQELLVVREFRQLYEEHNLVSNFSGLHALVELQARLPNLANLQLVYNALLAVWLVSFSGSINRTLLHNFPGLVGHLLAIAKELIKLKVVRVAVAVLRNFVAVSAAPSDQFTAVKLVLFHDGLTTLQTVQTRKFAASSADEELHSDLEYLCETLNTVVATKLSSFDEYMVQLENPHLLSWLSPTHKLEDFWAKNSARFKANGFALVKRMMALLQDSSLDVEVTGKVILLSDLQQLIAHLGLEVVHFVNDRGEYKLAIMDFLESSDNELKFQALRTIQLLVGQARSGDA